MAELTADDVETFTSGRLSASDDETQRMLDTALVVARSYTGWHVSPVKEGDTFTLDQPDRSLSGYVLRLPTQNVVTLTSVTENGVAVDLSTVAVVGGNDLYSPPVLGCKLVRHQGRWSCTPNTVIEIECDHGFSEAQAADWRQAILSLVADMASQVAVGRADTELASKQVDDVVYRWDGGHPSLTAVTPILDKYRLMGGWA